MNYWAAWQKQMLYLHSITTRIPSFDKWQWSGQYSHFQWKKWLLKQMWGCLLFRILMETPGYHSLLDSTLYSPSQVAHWTGTDALPPGCASLDAPSCYRHRKDSFPWSCFSASQTSTHSLLHVPPCNVVPGQEVTGTSWNTGGSLWTSGSTFSTVQVTENWHTMPGGTADGDPLRSSKATWTTCSRCCCLSRGLEQMASRGPFPPQLFWDSVVTNGCSLS